MLTTLTEREGLSQQELAARLYVTKGNISGLIDRLVANGLVERRALAGDRRSHAIHLTPAGRELAKRGIEAQKDFVSTKPLAGSRRNVWRFSRNCWSRSANSCGRKTIWPPKAPRLEPNPPSDGFLRLDFSA